MSAAVDETRLHDEDLPELFRVADATARAAQRRYLRSTAAQLGLLIVAAATGAFGAKVAQGLALAAFLAAAVLRTHLIASKPDAEWFEGRAAAESVKTMSWRFAVGGHPYRIDDSDAGQSERGFTSQLLEIVRPLTAIVLIPSVDPVDQVTPAMRRVRTAALADRRHVYLEDRIENQRHWYALRAREHHHRAHVWSFVMLGFEIVGVSGSVAKLLGTFSYDVVGLIATIAGAAAAWLQTRQHDSLVSAYSIAAREIAEIAAIAPDSGTEEEWAAFVEGAEGAISREHTLWRASRTT